MMMSKVKTIVKKTWKPVVFSICILIFIVLTKLLLSNQVESFDKFVYGIVSSIQNDYVTTLFKIITFFSGTYFIIGITVLIMILIKNKKTGFYIALNALLCCLLNQGIKFLVARPRPTDINIIEESGFSFPSGHSMMSVAFYGLLVYFISKKRWKKNKKVLLSILLAILVFLIGISRIYLGVHYASDVFAGFALSAAYLILFITIAFRKK